MTKIAEIRARRLIRQLAGGHKSLRIETLEHEQELNFFPKKVGEPWSVYVQNVRFYRINGKPKMTYQVRYKCSSQKVIVGIDFYNNFIKSCKKKKGNLELIINNDRFMLPNIEAGKFIINNHPVKHSDFLIAPCSEKK